jgi:gliding motility-associated-like protein
MKRNLICCLAFLLFYTYSKANHIVGGEMYYSLVSQSGNNYTYAFTLKLFKDATSGAPLDPSVNIAVYDRFTNAMVWSGSVSQSNIVMLNATPGPCIINPPVVQYQVGFYNFNLTLPGSNNGYIVTSARCCRVGNITNLVAPSTNYGATYTAEIPGTFADPTGPANSSAHFLGIDTVIICSGYPFFYNFGAEDANNDSLSYEFCDGYTSTGGTIPNPPAAPPYIPLSYQSPYTSLSPLGAGISINPQTGVVSGTAPTAGIYVVTVCVKEWRNGELIATQRKDLQVKVADCDLATVTLDPNGYTNCNDFTVSFTNLSPSTLITSYFWDFGVLSTLGDTSNIASPSFTYPDTGVYRVKLVANRNRPCSDSTTALVRVFPGFFPNFVSTPACINVPVQFTNLTTATYGNVNFWRWDFGVTSLSDDTSRVRNPQYTYNAVGGYTVELIAGSDKGCRDTIYNNVTVLDRPFINLNFRDTLICSVDTLQLFSSGSGTITWTPNYNIINPTSPAPFVYPKTTTWYKVELNNNGCRNQDSVRVRVVDFVSLTAGNDTTICINDNVQLNANTNGLLYSWSPAATLSNANTLFPIATPTGNTVYQITSIIGGCSATEDVVVNVAPRPTVNAGNDIMICKDVTAQLNAVMNGDAFTWSPTTSLSNPSILNPIANPAVTTQYILAVTSSTSGCPKPSYDTVTVIVLPPVNAYAGRDTTIIAGLPLQLLATGGTSYSWSPATGLNNPNIAGPVAMLDGNPPVIKYTVTVRDQAGCSDTASITINIFKTGPDIFVPTGFTPNGNGRNDVFRPIYVGMQTIDYFRVYNRWGRLLYSNNKNNGQGWDGTLDGIKQNSGAFIWMVRATDVLGKVHFKKGTVLLIR